MKTATDIFQKEIGLPHDFTMEIPSSSRLWLLQAGIDEAARTAYGIGYSNRMERTIIPISRDGVLIGSIARRAEGGSGPKYISNLPPYSIFRSLDDRRTYPQRDDLAVDCIITEDILSAIRVGRFVRTVALLGTGTGDAYLGRVLASVDDERIGIWTDPDNAGRGAAAQLVHGLTLAGKSCRVIKSKRDPKYYSDNEIRRYLND